MRWIFDLAEPDEFVDEVVRTTGAVIMGRRTYEVEDRDRPGIYGGADRNIFRRHPRATDRSSRLDDWNVVLLGANLARQCLELDRLDQILVQVTPILLGDGVRLFSRPDGQPIKLDKIAGGESGQITDIRYRVVK
jgi:dihydrofolate reductase